MLLLLHMTTSAQDVLTADIMYPTFNQHCQNGKIDLHINGGFPPYDVVWKRTIWSPSFPLYTYIVQENYGIQGNNDGEDLMNVMSGIYIVEVTDALCGTVRKRFGIQCGCSEDCRVDAEVVDAKCGVGGKIFAFIDCEEAGHSPFTYRWKDLKPWQENLLDRTDLKPGTYCLVATDVDGCEYENCWEVGNEDSDPKIQLTDKQNIPLCKGKGSCSGALTISVAPGATIEWANIPNPSQLFSNTVTDLCPGIYTVNVFMGNCTASASFKIECCATIDDSVEPIAVSGSVNSKNGSIILHVTGGASQIHYQWTGPNGFTSTSMNLIGGLVPGIYCVRVFDGCSEDKKCFEIIDCEANPIEVAASIEETCDGVAAGNITLAISGGNSPYTATWDNGMAGSSISNLPAGDYCVVVKDQSGCDTEEICFTVGSKKGTVTTSTTPCTRTVHCNGADYTEYFNYEQTLDCNTLYSYCPATGKTFAENLGWYNVYVSNCNLYGVCQDGQTVLLEVGSLKYGPFAVGASGCPVNIGCVDYACNIPGIGLVDAGAPTYCSSVVYQSSSECNKDWCWADVYCGNTWVAGGCVNYDCSFGKELEKINLAKELGVPTYTYTTESLLATINSEEFKKRSVDVKFHSTEKLNAKYNEGNKMIVDVHPNPSNGNIRLKFNRSINELTINVFDIIGRVVYSLNSSETLNHIDLDLSTQSAGVYFIHLSDSRGNLTVERIFIE